MLSNFEDLLKLAPFSLDRSAKAKMFTGALQELMQHHEKNCADYGNMLRHLGFDPGMQHDVEDYPSLPARMFKLRQLKSVADSDVRKVLTSSGTSGQAPSRIVLDAGTAVNQTKVLAKIVSDFIGNQRMPLLVIDAPSTTRARSQFSARAAGILGFSMFGRDVTYALDDDLELNEEAINRFCAAHAGRDVLLFGFTFIVYQNFIEALRRRGLRPQLSSATLIHGGGWKKLADRAIDNAAFKALLQEHAGISRVHNYYGLVEQTGSIFMECEHGRLHCSNFSDVVIRRNDFSPCAVGEPGLIELYSLLPWSYPGHAILTEDEGVLLGEDDCACGRSGKYFHVRGRIAAAEIRGCSDTLPST